MLNLLTEPQKAYIAGIIDGEGSIMGYKVSRKAAARGFGWKLGVSVGNTNYDLIHWLRDTTGIGSWRESSEPKNPKHKRAAKWYVSSRKDIEQLLEAVLPYLLIKRRNAELALEFVKLKPAYGRMEFRHIQVENQRIIVGEMQALNVKGPIKGKIT